MHHSTHPHRSHDQRAHSAPRSINGRYQHAREWNNNTNVNDTPSIALQRQGSRAAPRMHYGRYSPSGSDRYLVQGRSGVTQATPGANAFSHSSSAGAEAAVNVYGQLTTRGATNMTPFAQQDMGYHPPIQRITPASTATRLARNAVPGTTRGSIRINRDPASFAGR